MFDYHTDKQRYFEMQFLTARDFIIPLLAGFKTLKQGDRVLEIGCAEAGVLKAFLDIGLSCVGIDLNVSRIETARKFHAASLSSNKISFLSKNVYDIDVDNDLDGKFDLILLKDVIEHIPHQEQFIPVLKNYLKQGGLIFFAFPPWQMPFGGHQQMCKSKVLAKLPWMHLLPKWIYKSLLKWGGQDEATIREFLEIKETGLTLERFEKIIRNNSFVIKKRVLFFTNPIYKFKFNLNPRVLPGWLASIPFFRNFYTTAAYYVIGI